MCLVQDKRARKLTKKRVLCPLPPPTFDVAWTLIECFSALSSSVLSSAQNASWRNSLVSSKRAGGQVTKRKRPASSFDDAHIHTVYHEIIASLCTHSPSSSRFRPRTSNFKSVKRRVSKASPISKRGNYEYKIQSTIRPNYNVKGMCL